MKVYESVSVAFFGRLVVFFRLVVASVSVVAIAIVVCQVKYICFYCFDSLSLSVCLCLSSHTPAVLVIHFYYSNDWNIHFSRLTIAVTLI